MRRPNHSQEGLAQEQSADGGSLHHATWYVCITKKQDADNGATCGDAHRHDLSRDGAFGNRGLGTIAGGNDVRNATAATVGAK
jgi:hypothetical protein